MSLISPRVRVPLAALLLCAPLVVATPAGRAQAQTNDVSVQSSSYATPPAGAAKVPFAVGERLDYEVRFASIRVGSGSMEVQGIVDVRGRPSWHAVFAYSGSALFVKVNDRHETWFDIENLSSRRFHQDIDEGNYERKRRFEIFPERGMYKENDKPEEPTPQNPLDDASFLYFVRTLPLEVGKTYEFSRYFKAQGNPVRIKVLRRERVTVPAGSFNTVVLQPTFQSRGLFSEGGRAEVFITDDSARMMVQLKSKLPIGSLNLFLKSYSNKSAK